MIELRWYSTDNKSRTLQYRQRVDTTIRAGGPGTWNTESIMRTANYQWSDWADVPEVYQPPAYTGYPASNKCPKCGLALEGAVGYVCIQNDCPTGLGSSTS